jgi:hypothetical protein
MRHLVFLLALTALPAWADTQFRVRQMTRKDVPAGKGQCDIRLQVDNIVEVALHADIVSIHNLAGQDARDDGSECNAPLPGRDAPGFAFEVTDKRDEIRLVEPPSRQNHFRALVYIHDGPGGSGRYVFRISWLTAAETNHDIRRDFDDPRPGGLTWNNTIHSNGRGAGAASINDDAGKRLSEATVDIDRGGKILVSFRTESGPIRFTGFVSSWQGGTMKADVSADEVMQRLPGPMYLYFDAHQNVTRITLEATNGQDHLRLKWDARAGKRRP